MEFVPGMGRNGPVFFQNQHTFSTKGVNKIEFETNLRTSSEWATSPASASGEAGSSFFGRVTGSLSREIF